MSANRRRGRFPEPAAVVFPEPTPPTERGLYVGAKTAPVLPPDPAPKRTAPAPKTGIPKPPATGITTTWLRENRLKIHYSPSFPGGYRLERE